MIDTATVLARPDVQKEIGALAALAGGLVGISYSHADRMRIAIVDRLAEGTPVPPAIALVDAIQKATFEEISWNGCLTGDCPHDTQAECDSSIATDLRRLISPNRSDLNEPSTEREHMGSPSGGYPFRAAESEISALESQRENDGAGEAGGLLNVD